MTYSLFETLLYEDESPTLDFKREQYSFEKATDLEKSELLKDILAFCNAWRHNTAYILVGVEEIKGSRSKPLGISVHLDDAQLQQFVNAKVNQPIDFRYYAFPFENLSIGIIEIPVQARPVFLRSKYGHLESNKVYLRRGSSTAIADPTEVAKMGLNLNSNNEQAQLDLQFGINENRTAIGSQTKLTSTLIEPMLTAQKLESLAPNPTIESMKNPLGFSSLSTNSQFYQEVISYEAAKKLLNPLSFRIQNLGEKTISNLRVKGIVPRLPGLTIINEADHPEEPTTFFRLQAQETEDRENRHPCVRILSNQFEILGSYARLLPQEVIWTPNSLYIGADRSIEVELSFEIFADQLTKPLVVSLRIEVEARVEKRTLQEWAQISHSFD